MKTLLCLITILLLTAQSYAIPGCALYWMCDGAFFANGGSAIVLNPDNSSYYVDSTNYDPQAQYGIQAGSTIYVYRSSTQNCQPSLHWGDVTFIPCGQVSQGQSYYEYLSSQTSVEEYLGHAYCQCPSGSSGGISVVSRTRCQ